jgi:hypothetical protein
MADNFRSDRSRGPISDLARLISEVHDERVHAAGDFGEETVSVGYDNEPSGLSGSAQTFELHGQAYHVEITAALQMSGIRMKFRAYADAGLA